MLSIIIISLETGRGGGVTLKEGPVLGVLKLLDSLETHSHIMMFFFFFIHNSSCWWVYKTRSNAHLLFGMVACPTRDMHANLLLTTTLLCIARLCPAVCGVHLGTCILQADPQPPALFKDGDFVIGGAFTIHYYLNTEKHIYIRRPRPLECSGRLALDIKFNTIPEQS